MTLPFPQIMPPIGFREQTFEIQRVDYLSPENGGRVGGITAGFPLWKMTGSLGILTLDLSDSWRALVSGQRGAQRVFLGFDVGRQLPRAYPKGFPGGFTGACSSWSQAIDANGFAVLTLEGLPNGFAISTGDYVDFRWGTMSRAMVRAIEPGLASGGTASFSIEPPVPTIVPGAAIAHLDHPMCLMKLTSDTKLGATGRRGVIQSGTIDAVQDLIP